VNVRLSVNFIGAGGRFWKAGEELPEEIVPEHSRRYVLPDSPSGVVGSGRAAEPGEDVPAAVARERPRAAKEKARD
jgi:hypothetical protein